MCYYFTTDHYLSSVDMTSITQMNYCPVGCHCEISRSIDTTYQNIVQLLHSAAHDHCPLTSGSFFKSYWDEEMSELKQRSIDTHQLWQVCGRPRSGPIYRERCHARTEYRRAMRYKSKMASVRISNDLHDQLLTKDCMSFWRTWKNKVNNRRTTASQVDGYSNASDIATVFAKLFHQARYSLTVLKVPLNPNSINQSIFPIA